MGRQNGPGHASVINSHWAYRTRLYRIKCCSAEVTNSQQCREPRALFVYILALLCVQWLKRKWYDNVMSEMSDKCYCRNTTSWREGSGTLIFMTFLNSVVNLSHSDSAWSWKHRLNGSNASGVFTYLLVCVCESALWETGLCFCWDGTPRGAIFAIYATNLHSVMFVFSLTRHGDWRTGKTGLRASARLTFLSVFFRHQNMFAADSKAKPERPESFFHGGDKCRLSDVTITAFTFPFSLSASASVVIFRVIDGSMM